jgi:DNA recombination protein RmuC
MNAENPEDKKEALDRHIKSVRKHIEELSRKEYAKKRAKSFADYVLMFMPRDMAFRVALEAEPLLWQEAYQKNVLIATEQTIMPFLKIIQLTWNKFQQDTNTQKITVAAQNMIDRVGAFYDAYTDLGKKLSKCCFSGNSLLTACVDVNRLIFFRMCICPDEASDYFSKIFVNYLVLIEQNLVVC